MADGKIRPGLAECRTSHWNPSRELNGAEIDSGSGMACTLLTWTQSLQVVLVTEAKEAAASAGYPRPSHYSCPNLSPKTFLSPSLP
jgi:hypothetical protein